MAKGSNQKGKLLYLARILNEQTDEAHPMTVAQMIALLQEQGVDVRDRKSIYDDLETLRVFGMDIESSRNGRSCGYYVAGREFELPELKLLVDAVQSSRFITQNKTQKLIGKLEGLTSRHQARELQRQVYVTHRAKAANERIYYSVDALHAAIDAGRQIRFRYFEWVRSGSKVQEHLRRNGEAYQVSPWALIWDNENYYLVAYEAQSGELRHYRVDKMQDITLTEIPREGGEKYAQNDPGKYAGVMFGMFNGRVEQVRLRFDDSLIGVVTDRFGRDIFLIPDGDDHFIVNISAAVSPQFFSWLFSFGGKAELLAPESVKKEYLDALRAALKEEEQA